MISDFLLLAISVDFCFGVLLSPLENNDKLKHTTKKFVAEWQWESWPIKQELILAQDNRSPGPRINVALWKEPSRSAWYLFGGQPVDSNNTKVFSDIWKYSIETRTWEKFFPLPSGVKKQSGGKTDDMIVFRREILDELTESKQQPKNFNVFLCGDISKINATKPKKPDLWRTFYKRKKPEEEKKEELKSLAVYVPRTSKPNTVWQMDVKDNLWTAYVCCCEGANNSKTNSTQKSFKSIMLKVLQHNGTSEKEFNIQKNITNLDKESSIFDSKINKVEDEIDNTQQHLDIKHQIKKKKINQYKKGVVGSNMKIKLEKKRNVSQMNLEKVPGNETDDSVSSKNYTRVKNTSKKEKLDLKLREQQSNKKRKEDVADKLKITSYSCPSNLKSGEPVTWCDGQNQALITADISLSQIILWVYNLRTNHWSMMEVKIADGVQWSVCADIKTVRYAETGEEVYLFCTPKENSSNPTTSINNLTESSGILHRNNSIKKLVFRINYKKQILDSLGELRLNSYFGTPKGEAVWRNTTKSSLQAVKNSEDETILILAYLGVMDLWILTEGSQTNQYFDQIENIWRGSAFKWFDKYNAPFYNLQFVSESGGAETILIRNPRSIPVTEYWERERGKFIIRIFKNENLKNQSFENRTREQNLTYELLQSDNKPSGVESQFRRTYSYFIFFGISLAIFKIFVFAIFVKRLVEWSRKIKIRGECRKSPLIIRYSVIPDDLLQPVT